VRQPSALGIPRTAQEILCRHLLQLGLKAHLVEIDLKTIESDPAFAPVNWSTAGQPNVWATLLTPEPSRRTLD
jgi:hypothetical protein